MAIDKKINFEVQGGVKNYLGKQKEVKAPIKWKSSPDHPETELAYITKAEKDLLVKSDLHGSLKGGVNRGPSGIMSLNGYGSADESQNVGGGDISSAETGGDKSGMNERDAQEFRSAAIAAGAGQRVNPGFFDDRNTVSPFELAQAKAYNPTAFKDVRGSGIMNFVKSGGLFGNLVKDVGQRLGYGKKFDEPTYDMSEFNQYELGGSQTPTYYNDLDNELMEQIGAIRPKQTFTFDKTGRDVDRTMDYYSDVPNNLVSEVTKQDLKRQNQIQVLDYETARDIGVINPNMTEYEFEQIKKGVITEPGTYTA
tara:strand:- start:249 stop:1178 length:930 start_codon:yes stop_codon:yes gene_type:complete